MEKKPCYGAVVRTHGLSGTREHCIWKAMNSRCHNPNHAAYKYYGDRGITVHDRYRSTMPDGFVNFLNDVGKAPTVKHSIDRIDCNKGYEPGNIRWSTPKEQANNKRDNKIITHKGITMTLSQWGDIAIVNAVHIMHRLKRGWDVGRALSTPMKKGKIGYQVPNEKLRDPAKRRVRSWRIRMAAEVGLIPPVRK